LFGAFQSERPTAVSAPTEQTQTNKSLDPQVLEAVLQDLLSYTGKDAPHTYKESLLFAPDAVLYPITVENLLSRQNKDETAWKKLTPAKIKATQEATQYLIKRVKVKDGFK